MLPEQHHDEALLQQSSLQQQPLLEQLQRFADCLRDPQQPAPPDLAERRLQVYRELFFNNVSQLLGGMFPVARSVLDSEQWHTLVRDFYRSHRSETPLFPYVAEEFLVYLQAEGQEQLPAWFFALAHYEWMEAALRYSEDESLPTMDACVLSDAQLLQRSLRCSPLCRPLVYDWPVHRIGRHWQPTDEADAAQTCLLLFRAADDKVVFLESTAVTFALLHQLESGMVLAEAIAHVAVACDVSPAGEFTAQALASLRQMLQRGMMVSIS